MGYDDRVLGGGDKILQGKWFEAFSTEIPQTPEYEEK
jgi:hypothetical protein